MATELIEKANAALEKRAQIFAQRKAVVEDKALTDADKRSRVEAMDSDIASLESEARHWVTESEVRSAIAGASGLPATGKPEVRAGDLLAAEYRAITGASAIGAAFTPTENATFAVDFMAKASVLFRSGINVLRTGADSLAIPHMLSDGAAGAIAENTTLPVSDPTGESLVATPRKFAQATRIGNETLADSTPAILDNLAKSLLRSVGLAFDASGLEGNGTAPNVRGLKNVVGIQTLSMGANGLALANLDPIADAIGMLGEQNADDESAVIVMPPRTWRAIMKLKEATGSNKSLVQNSAGSATDGITRSLFGRKVLLSANLSLTEVQGSSSVANSIYVYVPSEVYAVVREDAIFTVNPWINQDADATLISAKMRADLLVPNPAAVVRVIGVL